MSTKNRIIFLWIATAVIVVAYMFWKPIFKATGGDLIKYNKTGEEGSGIDLFFPLQALFMLMLCAYIFIREKHTVSFVLLWLCSGNFIDELFFDNTTTYLSEIIYAGIGVIFSYIYNRKKLRENRK